MIKNTGWGRMVYTADPTPDNHLNHPYMKAKADAQVIYHNTPAENKRLDRKYGTASNGSGVGP